MIRWRKQRRFWLNEAEGLQKVISEQEDDLRAVEARLVLLGYDVL